MHHLRIRIAGLEQLELKTLEGGEEGGEGEVEFAVCQAVENY